MTSSLPKIKIFTENSESGSQKHLKFKKLKLNVNVNGESASQIRAKFKSIKSDRLSSLQRYSTVQQQREHKKQKIHLNLIERKLLSGTYDEAKQTGNDLNILKQKTDFYRTQSTLRKQQIDNIKLQTSQIKKQIEKLEGEKSEKQHKIDKYQMEFNENKEKTTQAIYEKSTYDHMIITRKAVNLHIVNKINEDRLYLTKLKSLQKQVDVELREVSERNKNYGRKIEKIHEQMIREQRTRQGYIYEKQSNIDRRKQDEQLREEKSKEYRKKLDDIEQEEQEKIYSNLYEGVMANKFAQRYCELTLLSLQQKYQKMENMYQRIGSYKKFNLKQPSEMVTRFQGLMPETVRFESQIKELQKISADVQSHHEKLLQKYSSCLITDKKQSSSLQSPKNSTEFQIEIMKEQEEREHEKLCHGYVRESIESSNKLQRINQWVERYGKQLETTVKKTSGWEGISKNLINIMKAVLRDLEVLEVLEKRRRINQ